MYLLPRRLTLTILAAAAMSLAAGAAAAAQEACLIVEAGRPQAVLAVTAELAAEIPEALADLERCIRAMTGAELPLQADAEPGTPTLYLAVESSPQGCPDQDRLGELNAEGFLIRTREERAWVCGRTPLAVQHGVYWLLEQWGCRWLYPGPAGEVLPRRSSLAVGAELQTAQQPHFLMRSLWYNWGSLQPPSVRQDYRNWMRRNRLEHSLHGSIGHIYRYIVPFDDEALFAEHPEYFPMVGDQRVRRGQICTGNDGVRERAVQYALDYFQSNPEASMVSMSPNDMGGPWRCPENADYARFSDAALDLANHVARALKARPATADKLVAMYAYMNTAFAPSFAAEDNVIIFVATRLSWLPWTWRLKSWSRKAELLGIRDYASILPWHWTRPVWRLDRLERNVRRWVEHGVVALSVESGNDWGGWGLYHYILGRLAWDPNQSVEWLYRDFLVSGFGPAAPAMDRYFKAWKLGYSEQGRLRALRSVAEALELADSEQRRWCVAQYGLYLHHLRLLDEHRSAETDQERRRALEALVRFGWRLAPTNMAHTAPLIDWHLRAGALSREHVSAAQFESWKQSDPFTIEEARELLAADLR